ncbi:hypothetical protein WR25_07500 [Diploscapter pachys]|uniref:Uncharacterized protein n=1 Tax=Diploscapter pachys TaxID=2018661 RepID=A0A2A2JK90_9BILA|nr:hypothetical protein WR25_07500 [Diploscapter pachys]
MGMELKGERERERANVERSQANYTGKEGKREIDGARGSSERPESGMNKPLADTMRIQNARGGKGDRKEEREMTRSYPPQLNGALRDWKARARVGPRPRCLASTLLSLPSTCPHVTRTPLLAAAIGKTIIHSRSPTLT